MQLIIGKAICVDGNFWGGGVLYNFVKDNYFKGICKYGYSICCDMITYNPDNCDIMMY